jgi:hypothetical protein
LLQYTRHKNDRTKVSIFVKSLRSARVSGDAPRISVLRPERMGMVVVKVEPEGADLVPELRFAQGGRQ